MISDTKVESYNKREKHVWSCWLFIWAESEALLSLALFPFFKLFSFYKHIMVTGNTFRFCMLLWIGSFTRSYPGLETMSLTGNNFVSGIYCTYEWGSCAKHCAKNSRFRHSIILICLFSKSHRDDSCMMGHINFTFRVVPDGGLAPYGSATAPLITYNETEAREPWCAKQSILELELWSL